MVQIQEEKLTRDQNWCPIARINGLISLKIIVIFLVTIQKCNVALNIDIDELCPLFKLGWTWP